MAYTIHVHVASISAVSQAKTDTAAFITAGDTVIIEVDPASGQSAINQDRKAPIGSRTARGRA